jgi:uncharacterized protein YndB with AHSA1/START domain
VAQQPSGPGGLLEPVRQSVRVRRPIEAAFELFTRDIGTWWPVGTHHARGDVVGVVFETRLGGRIYERCRDGAEADWGHVLAWEPPHRVVFTWAPGRSPGGPTEVEVRFTAEDPATTRVDLEHRGWERLGDLAAETRSSYLNGWPGVMRLYATAAGAAWRTESDPGPA